CLPVVDARGALVGLLTDRDVAMAAYTQRRRLEDIRVAAAMSWPPLTCAPTATLEQVEHLLTANAAHRLVVVDGGRVLGVITTDDLAAHRVDGSHVHEPDRPTPAPDETSGDGGALEFARNCRAVIQTVREEIHVDLGLAGEELRERWHTIERRFRAAEKRLESTRVEATKNLLALMDSAREVQRILRDTVAPGRTVH
ncbi:MAG TPA: CBS domain-containing protein, partial [Polyangia bacterium]|nr:CBS domain-containing protein [Polyangia bacterium]